MKGCRKAGLVGVCCVLGSAQAFVGPIVQGQNSPFRASQKVRQSRCLSSSTSFLRMASSEETETATSKTSNLAAASSGKKWDGKSIPEPNVLLATLRANASWEHGDGERVPVWDDMPNPTSSDIDGRWWDAYLPSEQEQDAAAAGFDWLNPEEWVENAKK